MKLDRFLNVKKSKTFARIVKKFKLDQAKVLDIGCSYGEYLINFGTGSLGINSSPGEAWAGNQQGLKILLGNAEELENIVPPDDKFDYIWANNIFEHLLSPHSFLIKLRKFTTHDSRVILGVPVVPRLSFLIRFKKFRGALASNHIDFFTIFTLACSLEKAGWIIEEKRPFFSRFKIIDYFWSIITPHIFMVCRKDPNFSYPPKKIGEWSDQAYYRNMLDLSKE